MILRRSIAAGLTLGIAVTGAVAVPSAAGASPASVAAPSTDASPESGAPAVAGAANPRLLVETVASGLAIAWDVGFLPDGKVLVTERSGRLRVLSSARPGARVSTVRASFSTWARGEGGLMGMAVHPDFSRTRLFTVCLNRAVGGRSRDVRLVTYRLSANGTSASLVRTLLTGIVANPSGRHSGCSLAIGSEDALYVGTGDAAGAPRAQALSSLGGKVLRLSYRTGKPWPSNPWVRSPNAHARYVYGYGHRNVQGLALRPGTSNLYSVEHGPDRDDEVNRVLAGRNYGWDPSRGGTTRRYDESVPMTDLRRFPSAARAVWSSGTPTEATSGAAFLRGARWGSWNGALAVAALKGSKVLVFRLNANGQVISKATPVELNRRYGRLRAARSGPDGALYLTTSNGSGDRVLRVRPA